MADGQAGVLRPTSNGECSLDLDGTAGLEIDLLGPVDGHELVGAQQRAVRAIEDVGEAVAVEVRERFDLLAVDVHVGEDVLVDAVIVPLVERRHLVGPDDLAGVDLAGENGHRPLVVPLAGVALLVGLVAAAIAGAPVTGVAGRPVDDLQLGIVAEPSPIRAAADLPVVAADRSVMPMSLPAVPKCGLALLVSGVRQTSLSEPVEWQFHTFLPVSRS